MKKFIALLGFVLFLIIAVALTAKKLGEGSKIKPQKENYSSIFEGGRK